jgi:hypothetical protein
MEGTMNQLANLVYMEDSGDVFRELKNIALLMESDHDFLPCEQAYGNVVRLFDGRYPGYRGSNTAYHDLTHTMHVSLALVRLIHGAFVEGERFTWEEINLAVISALMHDTGYIQKMNEQEGTGAKYTATHISRSIEFVEQHFRNDPEFNGKMPFFRDILNCTGLNTKVSEIVFPTRAIGLLGKMLGTADLLGQMSDRYYLEKLPELYDEFVEAGIKIFASQLDLLEKTFGFYDMTKKRLSRELGDVYEYARAHFRHRCDVDENLYITAIERNMGYLEAVLTHHKEDYKKYLKRTVPGKQQVME